MAKRKYSYLQWHATGGYPVVPGTSHGLLTRTSKMPSRSWGIPALGSLVTGSDGGRLAVRTCSGAVLRHKSLNVADRGFVAEDIDPKRFVCSVCYPRAKTSHYRYAPAKACHKARLEWTLRCLENEHSKDYWVAYVAEAMRWSANERGTGLVRVHDQGDFFSAAYAWAWVAVAETVLLHEPDVRLWFSTRSHYRRGDMSEHEAREYEGTMEAMRALDGLPNAVVRPSALVTVYGDEEALYEGLHLPPEVPGLSAGTMVLIDGVPVPDGVHLCPSHEQNSKCFGASVGGVDCDTCWKGHVPVAYKGTGDIRREKPLTKEVHDEALVGV